MYEYSFTFRSLTSAQQAAFDLSKHGISTTLKRAPKEISAKGCGYALYVSPEEAQAAASVLRSSHIRFEKAVLFDGSGGYQEVRF